MLNRLKNLVFGLEEFDKTKIEIRFDIVRGTIASIVIKELADFEILEEIIYKIKEELRVRSSNINKTIRNPSRNFRKKDVLELLENLVKIKYAFLEKAFNLMGNEGGFSLDDEVSTSMNDVLDDDGLDKVGTATDVLEEADSFSKKNVEKVEAETVYEPKTKTRKKEELSDLLSTSLNENVFNDDLILLKGPGFEARLENGKVPYILVNFEDEVNFPLLKNMASVFFEAYQVHGTNIIQDGLRVMILPRFQGDNLFELPRKEVDLDEVYEKILAKQKELDKLPVKKVNVDVKKQEDKKEDNVSDLDEVEDLGSENGLDGDEVNSQIKLDELKQKELDKKYLEFERKKELLRQEMEDGFLKISEDYRPKEKESLKAKEDTLDALLSSMNKTKKDMKPSPKPKEDSNDVQMEMDDPIEIEQKAPELEKEPEIEVETKTNDDKEIEKNDFEVYRDDKIFAYLNAYSSVMGELIIEPISGANMAYLEVGEISYISIFSKVFSTIVYELLGAEGTNLIWDFDSPKLRIIPRFAKDGLDNLKWELKSNTDEFLEQVKNKLLSEMQKEIQNDRSEEFKKAQDEKIAREKPPETELEAKGKFVLDALRKIP
ncbi:MAG: hypothetical protein KC589_02795 [Nanoarchaeota archaeon]|nr:hypothetical protein [Nanoarchaeota archaeon]MCA9495845.1 hypothetical protein [Nanoarchaeota archaeon]